MKYGFIKTAAVTPSITVADCAQNADNIIKLISRAADDGVRLIVFPELCITGYTCEDLFLHRTLLDAAETALSRIAESTAGKGIAAVVGLPLRKGTKLYNCAAVVFDGGILGIVPKTNIPNYSEFYEARRFAAAPESNGSIRVSGRDCPFGTKLLFRNAALPDFCFAAEICEDLWMPVPPSCAHAVAGATIIANLSASDETVGKDAYRRMLVKAQSAKLICGYIYADAGEGESTTDLVFSGHNIISENGAILAQAEPFGDGFAVSEIDVEKLCSERRRMTTYPTPGADGYDTIEFNMPLSETALTRRFEKKPFVPDDLSERDARCEQILSIQANGLKKRISHTRAGCAVVGISGGLDSCLALLVAVRAMDLLGRDRKDVIAVTMPCFGTTKRTRSNAGILCERLGVSFRCVDIAAAVKQHFEDIGHAADDYSVVYENAQARQRTLVLMDIANACNGLVVGTGDLSELALGWATYNGDHMSMYGVNSSVPKTLVRHIVGYAADTAADPALSEVLRDILDTPVSPELLPAGADGSIAQKTEDIVGPYELHDFFMYWLVRYGFSPKKVYRMAVYTFDGDYGKDVILKWLKTFVRRFFTQQFKRSCLPDGPKVGSVALSPRGDLRMPSDASSALWLKELEEL